MLGWQVNWRTPQETQGAVTASSTGTVITANASANTKGSWVDVGSAISYGYNTVLITAIVGSAGAADFTFDIGENQSGTRAIIAEDIRLPGLLGTRSNALSLSLPLHVRRGAQLSVRCQASTGSRTMEVMISGMAGGWGGAPGARRIAALYTPSSSRGVDIDPSSANTKTSYVTLVSGSTQPIRGVFFIIGNGGETTRSANNGYLVDIVIGSSPYHTILADMPVSVDSTSKIVTPNVIGPTWFASGTGAVTFAARAQAGVVTAGQRKIDIAAYGLVPF